MTDKPKEPAWHPKPWLTRPGGIAERLRAIHDATGLTGKELADRLGWLPSKVSRVRSGIVAPTDADLEAWTSATGGEAQLPELRAVLEETRQHRAATFRERMSNGQAPVQRDYNQLVAESEVIRYFEMAWIPGLLQTRDYARRVFLEMADLHGPPDDIEETVRTRMLRQQHLHDPAKRFEFLIDEPVLLRNFIPPDVMRPQLHYLLTWFDAPNVRLGILPLKAQPPHRRNPQNSFEMYGDVVIVEGFHGEDRPDDFDFDEVLDAMWQAATEGDEAQNLIVAAIDSLGE